jgi:hypothetical protein
MDKDYTNWTWDEVEHSKRENTNTFRIRQKSQNPIIIQEKERGHSSRTIAKKIFWDVAPCKLHRVSEEPAALCLERRRQCSGGTSFFHLQTSKTPKMEKSVTSQKNDIRLTHDHKKHEPQISEYRELQTLLLLWSFEIHVQNSGKINQNKIPPSLHTISPLRLCALT